MWLKNELFRFHTAKLYNVENVTKQKHKNLYFFKVFICNETHFKI